MARLGASRTIKADDVETWNKIRVMLKIPLEQEADAILVLPPWIDGKSASILGLMDLKDEPVNIGEVNIDA